MNKSNRFFEKCSISSTLIDLAYRDYIGARFLLNNQLVLQGLTLASTAVEKYLKAIIIFNLEITERYNYHFDRFEKLKELLAKSKCKLIEDFDPVFLNVLEKAFKIRYYDGLKEEIEIGIYLNQFIGELDEVINTLETYIVESKNNGNKFSPYWRAIEKKDSRLYEENFILNGIDKKKFMEKSGYAFSIYIQPGLVTNNEKICFGENISKTYEGRLSVFDEFLPSGEWRIIQDIFQNNFL